MKKYFQFLIITALLSVTYTARAQKPSDAIVKIFSTTNEMDYYRPWQSHGIEGATGSGTIIEGNRILTNAHVVADHTFIQVKKYGDPKKYTARVLVIGHDCDLALLTVDDLNFFKNVKPIALGELPNLNDKVTVLGYPQGGDKLSITEGVVSRVEITSYTQSTRKLLTVQIDAAINPGNSGGPVIKDGKLVGVAMQVLQSGQNIGYMIPPPIIEHFFDDFKDGRYDGFPLLGIDFQTTENNTLRKFYGLTQDGGVFVNNILPFSPALKYLEENDIVLEIDGIPIGEDGTFKFRDDERLTLSYLISKKHINDSIELKILRDKKIQNVNVKLFGFIPLVAPPKFFEKPSYYIYGGIVFTVLSIDLIKSWGNGWWEKGPIDLNYYIIGQGRLNPEENKDLVVLLSVLSDDLNVGYHGAANQIVTHVNSKEISSFNEFVEIINEAKNTQEYTIIETQNSMQIILDNNNIDLQDEQIIKRNNIPSQYSADVKEWLDNNKE